MIKRILKCRLCKSKKIFKVIDLKKSPLANNLKNNPKFSLKQIKFPLCVVFCKSCYHLQLSHIVSPKILFNKYFYLTGVSKSTHVHFEKYKKSILKKLKKNQKKILEIASNDGTFLKKFDNTFTKFGVEPAKNLKKFYDKKKIKLINTFFNQQTSLKIKKKYGDFDIITANNVCAHIDNFDNFIKGIKIILSKNGIFVFEVSYLKEVLKKNTFDTIYHEHLDYHSLGPLKNYLKKFDLRIFDIEFPTAQGGSIRIYACHNSSGKKINNKVDLIIKNERKIGLYKMITYKKFQKKLITIKKKLNLLLKNIKIKKKIIYGYGAAAKTTTLLNFFEINHQIIDKIIDDNKLKQGKYVPGTEIKIHNSKILYTDKPDFVILLSWNFAKYIIDKHKKFKKIGKFIIPFPSPRILH